MWAGLVLLFAAAPGGELPGVGVWLDFESAELPGGVRLAGRVEIVPGKNGKAARFARPDAAVDLTKTVYKGKGRHCGFPSLIRLQNGQLLAHFREGPGHVGRPASFAPATTAGPGATSR